MCQNNRQFIGSESINDIAMFVLNSFYIADINLSEGDMSLIYDMIINRIEKATKIIDETFSQMIIGNKRR